MRKILLLFIYIFLLSFTTHAKDSSNKQTNIDVKIILDTLKTHTIVDTLKIQVPASTLNSKNKTDHIPWIVAFIIGILTVASTVFASIINRKITLKGIQTNKDIAIEQIQNSQNISLQQFNSTLKTKNRQEWLNDLRNTMSEFMASCKKINIEIQTPNIDTNENIKIIHEKISFNRTKLILLLTPKKELHKNLLDSIKEFVDILDEHLLNYKGNINDYKNLDFQKASDSMVENARILLYDEWQKIQKLSENL